MSQNLEEKNKSYLGTGVLRVAIQISKHTGERVDIGVDF